MSTPEELQQKAARDSLNALITNTVTQVVQSDQFVESLAAAIVRRMKVDGIANKGMAETAPEPIYMWVVKLSDHMVDENSFRMFVESTEGEITAEQLQIVDGENTREDVVEAILDHLNASQVKSGKMYWVNLTHVTSNDPKMMEQQHG